ncbi:RING protein [Venustampulla echinocandica]|uniref:RING protein n=1 Tax=Venustampulla echinocandica TaxID=2656787 RepID=A0A370TP92_9HELO|nr:RING protein [Venustampulla echinocandica]RDL37349.1 RING protein [Venustampulla echinocandica]
MPSPRHPLGDHSLPYTVHTELDSDDEVSLDTDTITDGDNITASPSSRGLHKSRPPTFNLNLRHTVDLRAITYNGTVDENLVCPICRCPFVDPVLTDCDHVFCRPCIDDALSESQLCPIDRLPLSSDAVSRAPKMIFNQLDALKAKCPCCGVVLARSMLESHLEKYCLEAVVRCPGAECVKLVKRKISGEDCLHYPMVCPDCKETHDEIDMEAHRENSCNERLKACEHCSAEILRCKEEQHEGECPDVVQPCKWAEYGCQDEAKRKDLPLHADECSYKAMGQMAETLKKEIRSLRSEVRTMNETHHLQERRIKFLEGGQRASDRPLDMMDLSLANLPESTGADALESGHEYLLSLLEAQQGRLSQLSAEVSDFQAKSTMMLFNETLPIKNELAELRSTQQVTCMHVRWLMRFRMQENQRRFGGGPGATSNGGSDGGSSSDLSMGRRLSDSLTRDIITKL